MCTFEVLDNSILAMLARPRCSPALFCNQFQISHYYCCLASSRVVTVLRRLQTNARYATIPTRQSSNGSRAHYAITRWHLTLS